MNIYALLSLLFFIIIFGLGSFVYHQNKRDSLNIIFALHCLFVSFDAFCEFMYRQAESLQTAYLWLKISSLWPMAMAFLLHFALIFTCHREFLKNRLSYLLIYLPALLACIGTFIFIEPVKAYWGYTYQHSLPMAIVGITNGLYGFGSFILFVISYLTNPDPVKKQQTKVIVLGQLFPTFSGILLNGLFSGLNLPELMLAAITIFAGFAVYAIGKYQLFVINPATTAENIIQTMPDTLILMDPDFIILEANQALITLLGYQRKELLGAPIDILFGNLGEIKAKIREKLFSQGLIQNFETNYQTKQGVSIPIFFTGSVIKDKAGNIAGLVGIGSDIRGIKQLQTQLFQSETLRAVGQLAGGVAHQMNNPLGVILGFTQSLVKRINEDDPLYLPLKSIEREAVRCKKLVGDLLTFSRIERSQVELIDINLAIDATLTLIEAGTPVNHIDIIKEYQPDLPRISANRNQIQQLILNIFNNAVDAMPDNGCVKVTTRKAGNQIEISISDTGTGMTDEVKKHIFEPFFTTKDIGKGTGLGLSLCYQIIENHQGSIKVESEPGQGTTFIIKLPEKRS